MPDNLPVQAKGDFWRFTRKHGLPRLAGFI
jgi:hypothetical protein